MLSSTDLRKVKKQALDYTVNPRSELNNLP